MQTSQLHNRFGVEVHDVDLADVDASSGYPEIRAAFDEHSLLLFRNQHLTEEQQLRFGELFGPIEDRSQGKNKSGPQMSHVSNKTSKDRFAGADSHQLLNLKANGLWHTDSTFLPVPSLANIIMARVLPSEGGSTELVSTRAAWQDMPEVLKRKATDAILWHRYTHSRSKISSALAKEELFTMWPDQAWRALWTNPVNGSEALYIASHAFTVDTFEDPEGQAIIDELTDWCTQPRYIYEHEWQLGDLLVWDERATLHRGRPWPYKQERTLTSICITARACDGLHSILPPASVQDKPEIRGGTL